MPAIRMEFVVTWKSTKEAELFYLLDNGNVVPLAGKEKVGKGRITIPYLADDTGVHLLEWGLTFPNKTLSGFKATVSISNGQPEELATEDDDQKHKWISEGEVQG
jgi:hypothetical protein